MSNIAEGFERRGDVEFGRFLSMAKASAGEVRSQLYVALDLNYVDEPQFMTAFQLAESTSALVGAFLAYLRNKSSAAAKTSA